MGKTIKGLDKKAKKYFKDERKRRKEGSDYYNYPKKNRIDKDEEGDI